MSIHTNQRGGNIMRTQYKTIVIMSVYQSGLEATYNAMNHVTFKNTLSELGILTFKEVIGSYKGVMEMSLMVEVKSDVVFKVLLDIAKKFNQESILYRDNENNAELIMINDSLDRVYLGKLEQVSEEIARAGDAFTFEPESKTYYKAV